MPTGAFATTLTTMRSGQHGVYGRRSRHVLALGVACACAPFVECASAQAPSNIVGVVTDSVAGIGISGAEVLLQGSSLHASTDVHGAFRIVGASDGGTLRVRRLGYRPTTVLVRAGESNLRIPLAPTVASLARIVVRGARGRYTGRLAGYFERLERRTQGQFITRADLERERPAQLTDMLQRNPGIRITRGRPGAQSVRMRGRDCRPLIWIDGAAMSAGDVDLDSFSPASLEGIEMYLGAANAPPRYQAARGQSECGTILLWSRGPDTEPRPTLRGATPEELEELIAALSVFTSEQVEVQATLDAPDAWQVPYPPSLRAAGTSGLVIAEFVVDTLGRVEAGNFGIVSSTNPFFSAAVRESAPDARFRPAWLNGRRVRQLVRQPFEFRPIADPR
jgi:TonB family protein